MRSPNKYLGLKSQKIQDIDVDVRTAVLTLKLKAGRKQVINLSFFKEGVYPRLQMIRMFGWYFLHTAQEVAPDTRSNRLSSLRKFNCFLNWKAERAENVASTTAISTELLLEYQLWLGGIAHIRGKTAHYYYESLANILSYLLTNKAQALPPGLKIPSSKFLSARYEPATSEVLSIIDLRKIVDAATIGIEEVRRNHATAKVLLAEGEERTPYTKRGNCKPGYWSSLANALVHLVKQVGINSAPPTSTCTTISMSGHPPWRSILNMYIPAFERSFIPFLIMLYIRTAINVESLFRLKRNCLKEQPLPLDLIILEFEKPRSGSARNKHLVFPADQKNGVVDLIRFLLEYTQPLVPFAREGEEDDLFLYKTSLSGTGQGVIRSPGTQFTKDALKDFIRSNDLPDFSFAQIRPTVATLIYLQTRDIFRVQRLLCHINVLTTISYIKQELTRQEHSFQIHNGIESLVDSILGSDSATSKPTIFTIPLRSALKEKIESGEVSAEQAMMIDAGACSTGIARCKNPYNSPIPGEQKGHLCRQLHMCIFCQNAWIFEEDLPKVIHYRDSLLADRKKLTEAAWDNLHGTAFREITKEILPSYSQEVIKQAAYKAREMFNPYPLTEVNGED